METTNLRKMFFNLDSANPVEVLCNKHVEFEDAWNDMHYQVEVGIVLNGRMRRKYLNFEKDLFPGDIWINGIWEPHGFELLEVPCEVVVFIIDPAFLLKENQLNLFLFSPFNVLPEFRPGVGSNFKAEVYALGLKAKTRSLGRSGTAWSQILLMELMLILTNDWYPPTNPNYTYHLPKSIQPSLKLVFENKRFISTEEAAFECGMSVAKFRNEFKEFMKISFSEFALEFRVQGALAELEKYSPTLDSVAQNWGFTDASHLSRYIKRKEMNKSPSCRK